MFGIFTCLLKMQTIQKSKLKDLRVQVGDQLFPLTQGQVQEIRRYRKGNGYDKAWLRVADTGAYFVTMNSKRLPILVQSPLAVVDAKLPKTIGGVVVNNGGNYFAIKLQDPKITEGMLHDEATKYADTHKLTGKYKHPLSWTAYGTKPLGPHVSLTAAAHKHVGKKLRVTVERWHAFSDGGSRWIVLTCKIPKYLACEHECHISCAQQKY
jgi:uncharacterized protein (DUF736 family)